MTDAGSGRCWFSNSSERREKRGEPDKQLIFEESERRRINIRRRIGCKRTSLKEDRRWRGCRKLSTGQRVSSWKSLACCICCRASTGLLTTGKSATRRRFSKWLVLPAVYEQRESGTEDNDQIGQREDWPRSCITIVSCNLL